MIYNVLMGYLAAKFILTALIIVAVSEIAKRSGWLGGLVASLPIVSILSFLWVYLEQNETKTIIALSYSIAWFILPSWVLFLTLPLLLNRGLSFYPALAIACVLTMLAYAGFIVLLEKLGIHHYSR